MEKKNEMKMKCLSLLTHFLTPCNYIVNILYGYKEDPLALQGGQNSMKTQLVDGGFVKLEVRVWTM